MEQLNNIELTSPCSKTIGELMPCDGGWFCNACNKKVHDFRQMGEEAILNKIGINTNICGAFKYEQINLAPRHFSFKRWLFTSFLAVGFSSLHQVVFAQSDSSKKTKENTLMVTTAKDTNKEKIRIGGVSKTKAALYIIDGKMASGNPLKKVNPNDILRIDVLKSDSALKVYGRRAKYGVIIVTTKKKP